MLFKIKKLYAIWQLLEKPICEHEGTRCLKDILKLAFEYRENTKMPEDMHRCFRTIVAFQNARNFFFGLPKEITDKLQRIREM
ncbi:MAG: hypothetical protein COU51_00585 [Parcubacteria group bacterium CG10_big_fil_rev_8_21_14_0_10_36_14]|nr:MAG: hypothetical protein COU51_00585 [Parcubacteria group bacterium CG10_big_fil_rev_8_21_14_0_10_36_14]